MNKLLLGLVSLSCVVAIVLSQSSYRYGGGRRLERTEFRPYGPGYGYGYGGVYGGGGAGGGGGGIFGILIFLFVFIVLIGVLFPSGLGAPGGIGIGIPPAPPSSGAG